MLTRYLAIFLSWCLQSTTTPGFFCPTDSFQTNPRSHPTRNSRTCGNSRCSSNNLVYGSRPGRCRRLRGPCNDFRRNRGNFRCSTSSSRIAYNYHWINSMFAFGVLPDMNRNACSVLHLKGGMAYFLPPHVV